MSPAAVTAEKDAIVAQVIVVDSPEEAGALAAGAILNALGDKPDLVLGLATGSSPQVIYAALASRIGDEHIDVSGMRAFALDEYVGLPAQHPASYRSTIEREVIIPLGLDPTRVVVPPGSFDDAPSAGESVEAQIRDCGGVDIQILGIGTNGHVGFNEPGSSLASLTRVKMLAEQTRRDNARFFDSLEDVPTHCVTQGIGTILRARRILMVAFGDSKADAIVRAVEGPVSSSCPASAIQLHPQVTILADKAAASRLNQLEYYRKAWDVKPEWQHL